MADNEKMFRVQVITPDRIFYTGEAEMIEFTTNSGQIGVYKNHIPLTTVLAPAKKRAEERLSAKTADIDLARAEFALRKALTRIDVKDMK